MSETEVVCRANNDATLGGLVTVFHVERSADSLENPQNDMPVRDNAPNPRAAVCLA